MHPSVSAQALGLFAAALAMAACLATWALTSRRWRRLLRAAGGPGIESLLLDQQRELAAVRVALAEVRARQSAIDERLAGCVLTPGLIRFNAFADTGSDLSFALAFLDGHGSGVVVSSLYGREDSRTYAKQVSGGASPHRLSDEEREAIRLAWTR